MCPCRCKGSVAWHNTCNSNSTGLDIPCCQSCQCRCKGSPVASLNKGLDIPCCQSCQCRCKGSPVASLNKGLDIPCCQSCQCRCKGSPVASLNKGLDIPCCQSCQCRCKGSPVALFTHRLGLLCIFSTFFRLTSDFDNFGFFQAPGSNPQGSNPTNERVDILSVVITLQLEDHRIHRSRIGIVHWRIPRFNDYHYQPKVNFVESGPNRTCSSEAVSATRFIWGLANS